MKKTHLYYPFHEALLLGLLIMFSFESSFAGSATWNATPTSQYWSNPDNWTPATVPKETEDTATFDVSSITSLDQMYLSVGSIVFNPGASAYTLNPFNPFIATMGGPGIINNSGVTQNIKVPAVPQFVGDEESYNLLVFANNATAGNMVQYTVYGSSCADGKTDDAGWIMFDNNATAGSASFIVFSGTKGFYDCHGGAGAVDFIGTSSAGNAMFINNGGRVRDGNEAHTSFSDNATAASATITNYGGFNGIDGARVYFYGESSAGDATVTNNAGERMGGFGGQTYFFDATTAGNATLIANNGAGEGGKIFLEEDSTGGTARLEVFGDASLDISNHNSPGVTIGSLEGDGLVLLGANNLTLGASNLSTIFSGLIQDGESGDTGGSLTKIGSANLTLANANSYTGGTIISGGILIANNTGGSATGSGPVRVAAGTLGGSGTIAGSVLVGTGSNTGAILGPGNETTPGILTIQNKLRFKGDATYRVSINSNTPAADQVAANGIKIDGSVIQLADFGTTVLPPGTSFIVISNTSPSAIFGMFSNLADGSTIIIGPNTFQANYQGGDGNDLTLTAVP